MFIQVKEVHAHPEYLGSSRNFASDIALLDLDEPIAINAFIVPVCVDWGLSKTPRLPTGNTGKVC